MNAKRPKFSKIFNRKKLERKLQSGNQPNEHSNNQQKINKVRRLKALFSDDPRKEE